MVPRDSTQVNQTRVSHKYLELLEIVPQVWVFQTAKLVRAYHERRTFSELEVADITAPMKDWEKAHQKDIRKLVALITRIPQATRSWGEISTIR